MPSLILSDTMLPIGRHTAILTKLYFGALNKRLELLDIERHYSVIILIGSSDNCCQQYISDTLKIDKASMVRIIDYLVKAGYVKRVVNEADRREHILQLTAKAKKNLPKVFKAVEELNHSATKGLTARQVKDFYHSMHVISSNLENEPFNKVIINYKTAKKKNEK